eukprot:GHVU01134406.1.p2 GENE.GHVU01134406.1~~GHVU01134406.1.p2  ORF type:complete len:112 (-),score=12.18 GHVU01134406.1:232-567(-)
MSGDLVGHWSSHPNKQKESGRRSKKSSTEAVMRGGGRLIHPQDDQETTTIMQRFSDHLKRADALQHSHPAGETGMMLVTQRTTPQSGKEAGEPPQRRRDISTLLKSIEYPL